MAYIWPTYTNVPCICCCTVLTAKLIFKAFIREAFPFQRAFCALMFLLESKEQVGKAAWASFDVNTLICDTF
jgi:hypothetical protein